MINATKTEQRTEAHRIIEALAEIEAELTVQDARFVASWKQYLNRAGNGAIVGPYRLAHLRLLKQIYLDGKTEPANAA